MKFSFHILALGVGFVSETRPYHANPNPPRKYRKTVSMLAPEVLPTLDCFRERKPIPTNKPKLEETVETIIVCIYLPLTSHTKQRFKRN